VHQPNNAMIRWLAPRRTARRLRTGDAGFTMAETLVAMTVFAVMATAGLGMLVRSTDVTRSNSRRAVAASLANRAVESIRGTRALDIPNGLVTRSETVGGVAYTVKQTATYVVNGSATNACSATGNTLSYKLVTVNVTWPQMGRVQPVRADTLKSLGLGTDGLSSTLGSLAVSVAGATGAALGGIPVLLSPGGQTITTGDDGCALFTGLAAGTYTATANVADYVGSGGLQQTTVASLGVVANQVTRGSLVYDTARAISVAWSAPGTVSVPTGIPLMLRNSYLTARSFPACSAVTASPQSCVSSMPGTVTTLFPASYDVWAGSCSDAVQPAAVNLTNDTGAAVPVTVGLAQVHINTVTALGVPLIGRALYAVHAAETVAPGAVGCATGATYPLVSSAAGGVDVALPYGTWKLSVSPIAALGVGTATVTLTPAGAVPTVSLVTT
jgi:prepilin-type N-terminal cleavage/methylation domain-containing protein